MALFYWSIPVSHDWEPACATPGEAAKWNSAIIHFITYPCAFLTDMSKCPQNVLSEKEPIGNSLCSKTTRTSKYESTLEACSLSMPLKPMRLCDPAVPVDSLRERHPRECCTVYVAMVTELSWDRREEKMVRHVHQIQMSLQVNAHHPTWALMLWHAGLSATALRDDIRVGRMEGRLKTSACQQLSLHGGLSDMDEVSLQYAALQVSVRQESAKASLILKI